MKTSYSCAALLVLLACPSDASQPVVMFVPGPGHTMFAKTGDMTALLSRSQIRLSSGADPQVCVRFDRASNVAPQGLDPLPGRLNFLLGSDPDKWRTNLPVFARAVYRSLWPGIDVTLYGRDGGLEYDFTLHPITV